MKVEQVIIECNRLFSEKEIDIIKYNIYSSNWWRGRQAVLLKKYNNISGDVIEKGCEVSILFKMQKGRFRNYIHTGQFYVKDMNNIQIGGIEYYDLILK